MNKLALTELWHPPGKDCGLCGNQSCREFLHSVINEGRSYDGCHFYGYTSIREKAGTKEKCREAEYRGRDVLGHEI
ncbi:MAG: (Fe-S)-binding protein [Bacillota bacterium]